MKADAATKSTTTVPAGQRRWQRSSYCANGACVEVAVVDATGAGADLRVGIRDAKDPAAGELWLSPGEFRAFVSAVRGGSFSA